MRDAEAVCGGAEDCCFIAPNPELADRFKADLAQLSESSSGDMRTALHTRLSSSLGLNDGLIQGGSDFPIDAGLRVLRSKALDRAPLRGVLRIIVVRAEFPNWSKGRFFSD